MGARDPKSRACERVKAAAGGYDRLADQLGLTRQAVHKWRIVPVMRVLDVERLTKVPRWEQRPDIYPAPRRKAPKAAPIETAAA